MPLKTLQIVALFSKHRPFLQLCEINNMMMTTGTCIVNRKSNAQIGMIGIISHLLLHAVI